MNRWGLTIIDFHVHFFAQEKYVAWWESEYIDRFGRDRLETIRRDVRWYQEQWWKGYSLPLPEEKEPPAEIQAERWGEELERHGLAKIVFVTGGGNDLLASVIKRYPDRFIGFAHHDPFAPGAAIELRRAVVDLGMRGYKVLAPALKGPISDHSLYPLWETAKELGIPVLIHFGLMDGSVRIANHANINPLVLHDVAKGFPSVPFVVAHFGCGYLRELLHLCWACRNIYVDTSGNNEWMRWMPHPLSLEDLFRKFVETVGAERVIFGSDSEWFPRGFAVRYLEDQLRACWNIGLSEDGLRLIFGGNAARLLKLPIDETV